MIKFKEKTRKELIAGFKRAIERKKEFEEQAQKEFADMRKRGAELKSALWNRLIFLPLISMRHIPFGMWLIITIFAPNMELYLQDRFHGWWYDLGKWSLPICHRKRESHTFSQRPKIAWDHFLHYREFLQGKSWDTSVLVWNWRWKASVTQQAFCQVVQRVRPKTSLLFRHRRNERRRDREFRSHYRTKDKSHAKWDCRNV